MTMALNEAKEKVCLLENAIRKVDLIKKHLGRNASDIKGEIHSCVSHNLESLRGREVSLLSKVDEVVRLKEEALQCQEAKLNQALGVLQTRMSLMTTHSDLVDKQMAHALAQFNEMDLSPGETPHIAFRADHMSLKESIMNYGRVDANALPLPSAFDDPGKPSASVPRHFEEYDDVDHHIFHKTVEDFKPTKAITVTIPKLSTKMEDWLQKRLTTTGRMCSTPVQCPSVLEGFGSNPKKMSCQSRSSSSSRGDASSLTNWLSQIKSHADLEEEHDFEIVDNNNHIVDKKEKLDDTKLEEFTPWLLNSPQYLESVRTVPRQGYKFFQNIPEDSKVWLQHQISRLDDEVKRESFFHHISKEPSTWLRSRAYSKQAALSPSLNGNAEEKEEGEAGNVNRWLAQKHKTTDGERMENDKKKKNCCRPDWWHKGGESKTAPLIPFQLEDICKANELCVSLSDCVCKPNCLSMRQQEVCGVKNPLDPSKVFNPLQLPLSQWLVPDMRQDDVAAARASRSAGGQSLFSHMADLTSDQWMIQQLPPASEPSVTMTTPPFKHIKEEANLWLQQTQELSSVECESESMFDVNNSCQTLSDWLFQPKSQDGTDDEIMKEESEGWSLCSSPSTYNSDQFSKDVSVANSYMQKWIL